MLAPSLAVGLFTKILKENGYKVDLFDTTHYCNESASHPETRAKFAQTRKFDSKEDLGITVREDLLGDFRRKAIEFQPDLMLLSIVEDSFPKALDLLNSVSDLKIPNLVGGVFPTAAPDLCLQNDQINMVGLGEGEVTIIKVAEAIRLKKALHNIPGIWYKDENGTINKNPQLPLVDINKVIPDYGLFEENRFNRPWGGPIFKTIPIETYRGCPFQCTYCNSPMQLTFSKDNKLGSFLRRKNITVLRDELRFFRDLLDPEFFMFIDDSFLARPEKEIFEFCDMYEEFKLPFFINTRPECCSAERLKRLKEVGCYRISAAIESGHQDYRTKVLKRQGSNADIVRWFNILTGSGIPYAINLIIGFPGETREMVMDTVELVRAINGYDTLTVSVFTPYHGTVLREVALKNAWLDPSSVSRTHFTSSSALKMPAPYLSPNEIECLIRVMTLYCYFPKSEWENIKRAETNDQLGNELLEKYMEIYRTEFLGESQQQKQSFIVKGGTGCRANEKDSFRIENKKLSQNEIEMLTTIMG